MILYPTYFTYKVTDINFAFLKHLNIKGIILDVDDTLVAHRIPNPQQEVVEWINTLKLNRIKIILLSNNFKNRVKPFAKKLNIPYIHLSMKPLTFGLKKAIKNINCSPQETIVVGDQIFTDVLAANLLGIKSILVEPIKKSNSILFKVKRFFEKQIKKNLVLHSDFNLANINSDISEDKN